MRLNRNRKETFSKKIVNSKENKNKNKKKMMDDEVEMREGSGAISNVYYD